MQNHQLAMPLYTPEGLISRHYVTQVNSKMGNFSAGQIICRMSPKDHIPQIIFKLGQSFRARRAL